MELENHLDMECPSHVEFVGQTEKTLGSLTSSFKALDNSCWDCSVMEGDTAYGP